MGCHSCSAGQPRRQRAALGPVQPPDSPAARADSSLVSEGFFLPSSLEKDPSAGITDCIPGLLYPRSSPAQPPSPQNPNKKAKPQTKTAREKKKKSVWVCNLEMSL